MARLFIQKFIEKNHDFEVEEVDLYHDHIPRLEYEYFSGRSALVELNQAAPADIKVLLEDGKIYLDDKNVVDFVPNFDETEKEPEVLPVRVPNLLVNGADGIAVGMTTNIPPHNLSEVVDAVCAYMDNEDITTDELMQLCPGPDFPTGGIVINKSELGAIYETGTGKIKLRGKVVFEPAKNRSEKDKLVITEIPYTMIGANIGKFISDGVSLIETKKTTDLVDISNESS